jgi:hypothetical protein
MVYYDEVKIRVARPSVLCPSKELLQDFKSGKIDWAGYVRYSDKDEVAIYRKRK